MSQKRTSKSDQNRSFSGPTSAFLCLRGPSGVSKSGHFGTHFDVKIGVPKRVYGQLSAKRWPFLTTKRTFLDVKMTPFLVISGPGPDNQFPHLFLDQYTYNKPWLEGSPRWVAGGVPRWVAGGSKWGQNTPNGLEIPLPGGLF